ncbi:MAG: lipid IV(A) 3-deoxy-D-manno-octulosonic acid transferase [Steroidobacteraceae bacterium]
MRILYVVLARLAAPFVFATVLWRGLSDRAYWDHLGERFGFGRVHLTESSLWVHAVSVGEVQASAALVRGLRARYPNIPLVLTTVTPTGAALARSLFGDSVHLSYAPYDLPGSVRRFFDRTKPRLAVILETELWPTLYHECGKRNIPLVLASARISPRSVARYRWFIGLFRQALSNGIVIAAQSESDAARFRSIGANPARTHVTGNIKFDFEIPRALVSDGRSLRQSYAGDRPVWIAGSTHPGEEDAVLDAHAHVLAAIPTALLILVPRHPNRFDDAASNLKRRALTFARRSRRAGAPIPQVLLVDTLGELMMFYAATDVAFVGGSLVPIGGHNLLEPAALGLPILCGPYTFNAESIAQLLIEVGAVLKVRDADELGAQVARLLADPDERRSTGARGRATVEANRGALEKLLGLIAPLVG